MPTTSAFDLPDHLAAKAAPALIAADEQHFAAIGQNLTRMIAELSERLDQERRAPGGTGQEAMDRDWEVHRLAARLGTLRRYGLDLCLGHMVAVAAAAPVYVGRLGLTDGDGRRLLIDWRSPAAEPFFGATHANPMGLASRRRYRWMNGRITDYWDEVFTPDGFAGHAGALDDQSAFIASLGADRSARMRDVLTTIAADQDAIIRAGSRGALVVDGGPGTGKTVVALHRAAYLLYADPHVDHRSGGVLFIGPHQPYLDYVSDVLPSLGEQGVRTATLLDLLPEGPSAEHDTDPDVERLKSSAAMVGAIEPAVAMYETPPTKAMTVETPWADLRLAPADWAEAFAVADAGTPHNEAREMVWQALLAILVDRLRDQLGEAADDRWQDEDGFDAYGLAGEAADAEYHRSLAANAELVRAFGRAWPLLEAADVVGDLWSVPAYLRHCAPWLTPEQVVVLQRADAHAWTTADLPLLDAARLRLGDPQASRRHRQRESALAAERARIADVTADLIAHDDSEMRVMSMLRGQDLQAALIDSAALPAADPDTLAGPFAHVVVDEAQELTDAQWQMLLARNPSGSFTIVGDRAQARRGFTESWNQRLERIGLDQITVASLSINYRTPAEIMAEAEPIIRAALPDANVPTSIRTSGVPVHHGPVTELDAILSAWLAAHTEGIASIIHVGDSNDQTRHASSRVRSLTPQLAKGLEFDLVVLIDPQTFGDADGLIATAVDRYVAMTRATTQLAILTST